MTPRMVWFFITQAIIHFVYPSAVFFLLIFSYLLIIYPFSMFSLLFWKCLPVFFWHFLSVLCITTVFSPWSFGTGSFSSPFQVFDHYCPPIICLQLCLIVFFICPSYGFFLDSPDLYFVIILVYFHTKWSQNISRGRQNKKYYFFATFYTRARW